jgi:hypothetical protein
MGERRQYSTWKLDTLELFWGETVWSRHFQTYKVTCKVKTTGTFVHHFMTEVNSKHLILRKMWTVSFPYGRWFHIILPEFLPPKMIESLPDSIQKGTVSVSFPGTFSTRHVTRINKIIKPSTQQFLYNKHSYNESCNFSHRYMFRSIFDHHQEV